MKGLCGNAAFVTGGNRKSFRGTLVTCQGVVVVSWWIFLILWPSSEIVYPRTCFDCCTQCYWFSGQKVLWVCLPTAPQSCRRWSLWLSWDPSLLDLCCASTLLGVWWKCSVVPVVLGSWCRRNQELLQWEDLFEHPKDREGRWQACHLFMLLHRQGKAPIPTTFKELLSI